jgi:hypothetical protein
MSSSSAQWDSCATLIVIQRDGEHLAGIAVRTRIRSMNGIDLLMRVGFAVLLGVAIGIERQWRSRLTAMPRS